jgi:hypothetical protein
MNPNITWEIVQSNLDKDWDWWCLSETLYTSLEVEYGRNHMSAFLIQNRWRNICVDSHHPIGKKVILERYKNSYV